MSNPTIFVSKMESSQNNLVTPKSKKNDNNYSRIQKHIEMDDYFEEQPAKQNLTGTHLKNYRNKLNIKPLREEKIVLNPNKLSNLIPLKIMDQLVNFNQKRKGSTSESPIKKKLQWMDSQIKQNNLEDKIEKNHHYQIYTAQTFKQLDDIAVRFHKMGQQYQQYDLNDPLNQKKDIMPKTINEMSEEQILNYQTKQQLEEIANSPLKKVVKSKVDTNLDFKKIQVAKIKAETEEKSQFEFSERNHYDEEYTKLGKKIAKERVMKKFYVPPKQPIIFDPLKYRETFVLEKTDLNQQKNNQKQQNEYKNSNLNEMADAIKERREQKLKKDIENCELVKYFRDQNQIDNQNTITKKLEEIDSISKNYNLESQIPDISPINSTNQLISDQKNQGQTQPLKQDTKKVQKNSIKNKYNSLEIDKKKDGYENRNQKISNNILMQDQSIEEEKPRNYKGQFYKHQATQQQDKKMRSFSQYNPQNVEKIRSLTQNNNNFNQNFYPSNSIQENRNYIKNSQLSLSSASDFNENNFNQHQIQNLNYSKPQTGRNRILQSINQNYIKNLEYFENKNIKTVFKNKEISNQTINQIRENQKVQQNPGSNLKVQIPGNRNLLQKKYAANSSQSSLQDLIGQNNSNNNFYNQNENDMTNYSGKSPEDHIRSKVHFNLDDEQSSNKNLNQSNYDNNNSNNLNENNNNRNLVNQIRQQQQKQFAQNSIDSEKQLKQRRSKTINSQQTKEIQNINKFGHQVPKKNIQQIAEKKRNLLQNGIFQKNFYGPQQFNGRRFHSHSQYGDKLQLQDVNQDKVDVLVKTIERLTLTEKNINLDQKQQKYKNQFEQLGISTQKNGADFKQKFNLDQYYQPNNNIHINDQNNSNYNIKSNNNSNNNILLNSLKLVQLESKLQQQDLESELDFPKTVVKNNDSGFLIGLSPYRQKNKEEYQKVKNQRDLKLTPLGY